MYYYFFLYVFVEKLSDFHRITLQRDTPAPPEQPSAPCQCVRVSRPPVPVAPEPDSGLRSDSKFHGEFEHPPCHGSGSSSVMMTIVCSCFLCLILSPAFLDETLHEMLPSMSLPDTSDILSLHGGASWGSFIAMNFWLTLGQQGSPGRPMVSAMLNDPFTELIQ